MQVFTIVSLSVLTLILSSILLKSHCERFSRPLGQRRGLFAKAFVAGSSASWPLPTPAAFAAGGDEAAAGEANLKLPDLSSVQFLGVDGHKLLMIGIALLHLRPAVWIGHLYRLEELAGSPRDGRNLPVDLGNLQDLSDYAGKIPALALGFHCCHHPALFQGAAGISGPPSGDHPLLQSGRNRRQLRRGVVRHSRQHVRQFPHGVCQPARQGLSHFPDSPSRPA